MDYKQENQIIAVQQIVDLVAKDPPLAQVTGLIGSFNKVTSCRRGSKEDISVFVSRLFGLAAKTLMHSNRSSSS